MLQAAQALQLFPKTYPRCIEGAHRLTFAETGTCPTRLPMPPILQEQGFFGCLRVLKCLYLPLKLHGSPPPGNQHLSLPANIRSYLSKSRFHPLPLSTTSAVSSNTSSFTTKTSYRQNKFTQISKLMNSKAYTRS